MKTTTVLLIYSEEYITFYEALVPNLKTVLLDIHQYS